MTALRLDTPLRLALIVAALCVGVLHDAAPALATVCSNPPIQAVLKFQDAPPDAAFTLLSTTPIKVVLQVANTSRGDVLTTTGFSSTDFFRRLQLIGPAGTTINKSEEKLHVVSETFYCLSRGGTNLGTPASPAGIPVVPVEVLHAPPSQDAFFREYVIDDARTFYSLNQSGHYSLSAQFDLLTFDPSAPDVLIPDDVLITDCDQFPGTTLVPVAAIEGRQECTVVSNTLELLFFGAPVAANSRIRGTSPVVANGVASSTIEITLNDANNLGVSGVVPPPTFSATGSGNTIGPCAPTTASGVYGVYNCTLKSTTAEIKTLSITSPVSRLGGTVTFTSAPADSLVISPQDTTVAQGGSEFYTVKALDANGNSSDVTSSTTFSMSPSTSGSCLAGGTCTAKATGTVKATNSGKSTSTTLTVQSPVAYAKVWVGLATSDDIGLKFDLKAVVTSGGHPTTAQLGSVGGGNGFTKALLDSIPLYSASGPITLSTGDTLELFVRNACSGSTKPSGRARLWFNGKGIDAGTGKDAGSRLEVPNGTPTPTKYWLGTGFALNDAAGSSRTFKDISVGAKCGPYQSFGVWRKP